MDTIQTSDSAVQSEIAAFVSGLDDYCAYNVSSLNATDDAQGVSCHDGINTSISAALSEWQKLLRHDAQVLADINSSLHQADDSSAKGMFLLG
ncbi:hypothetical protein [Lancefieldella rimae]|uniref:Uncharacterized protein n=1 Tax=Lancefieldella rimae TaxID=1383 RepID=A0A930VYM7_9ACTN|nr:hypothetical protein [Lancefieldella rimae]